jgi:hypothetical protein
MDTAKIRTAQLAERARERAAERAKRRRRMPPMSYLGPTAPSPTDGSISRGSTDTATKGQPGGAYQPNRVWQALGLAEPNREPHPGPWAPCPDGIVDLSPDDGGATNDGRVAPGRHDYGSALS